MINKTALFFEIFAKNLGLEIQIPRPSRSTRKICATTNTVVGLTCVGTGLMMPSKVLVGIGALGLAGATFLIMDKIEKTD
ncbi:TPA: hypothetical protein ACOAUU_001803 [Enterococcus faecium]|uniref:Holin n=1 Tax=Enterococcus faecium TaxID=1352 RepID=A0AB73N3R2_ENTFC|nr:hypothetical protein [Enterococcus faecium]EGW2153876.1 hypothetical protein [Enterococcus faecium]EME8246245.1 hypothetical protein [Enterococcus faecium]NTQ64893.1 hypothetical protein [Enterococcus faecium]OTN99783.1 hypothetical protein A5804_001274 [Enterococcus faecium]OUZ31201.1 hypothetical protein A5806_000481 [Enterococcus faecium]